MSSLGILGGGITGLGALHFAKKSRSLPLKVRLLEQKSHVGGWANTSNKKVPGRDMQHVFERGPRSIRGVANGEVTLGIVADVGMASDIILPSSESSKRFLYMGGKVTALPTSALGALRPPVSRYIPAILKDAILSRKSDAADESVASFFERHVGTKATHEMVGGIVVGIYGGDMSKLSMAACFSNFANAARAHKSLVRGLLLSPPSKSQVPTIADNLDMNAAQRKEYEELVQRVKKGGAMFSFREGIGMLPAKLESMYAEDIDRGVKISKIVKGSHGKLDLFVAGEDVPRSFDRVVSCLPSYELANILEDTSPNASQLLREIEFTNMAVISLAFEEKAGEQLIPPHLKGFGYLVPPFENRPILGVAFDSVTFPRDGGLVRMAVMIGGAAPNRIDVTNRSQDELLKIALTTIDEDLGIKKAPVSSDVFIAYNAIPQYKVGHFDQVRAIESAITKDFPQLHIAGASFDGVSVNDCVASGMKASLKAILALAPRHFNSL